MISLRAQTWTCTSVKATSYQQTQSQRSWCKTNRQGCNNRFSLRPGTYAWSTYLSILLSPHFQAECHPGHGSLHESHTREKRKFTVGQGHLDNGHAGVHGDGGDEGARVIKMMETTVITNHKLFPTVNGSFVRVSRMRRIDWKVVMMIHFSQAVDDTLPISHSTYFPHLMTHS